MTNSAFITSRSIFESDIWTSKPSWWLKVWLYILGNVSFSDKGKYERGTALFSYDKIYFDCNLSKEGIKKRTIDNALRWLKTNDMIATQKTTRGFYITVLKYNEYQVLNNYKNDTENDKSTQKKRQVNDTIIEEDNKYKEDNIYKHIFTDFIKNRNLDSVMKMKKQLTEDECNKLLKKFGENVVKNTLIAMDNKVGLEKKYKSVYATCGSWCNLSINKK